LTRNKISSSIKSYSQEVGYIIQLGLFWNKEQHNIETEEKYMASKRGKLEREKKTLSAMLWIYCRNHHGAAGSYMNMQTSGCRNAHLVKRRAPVLNVKYTVINPRCASGYEMLCGTPGREC
jgi:hypothetical protein